MLSVILIFSRRTLTPFRVENNGSGAVTEQHTFSVRGYNGCDESRW